MSMVARGERIASAFVVCFGAYGDVSRRAQERGVCRQWIYREADWVVSTLQGTGQREEVEHWRQRVRELEQRQEEWQQRQAQTVVLDQNKQEEFAW